MENNYLNGLLVNWSDVFVPVVNQHIPKNKRKNVNEYPLIDHELSKSKTK